MLTRADVRIAIAATVGILAVYAWLLYPQLRKPFVYDDVNFALGARAVAATGLPFGNQGYLVHTFWLREQWALWHPPLYIFSLGFVYWMFGSGEISGRMFGVACQLVTAGLAADLARRLALSWGAPVANAVIAMPLALALFLLAPLTVQSALVLDIDNTVLMLLITLFAWLVVRLPGAWSLRTIAWFSALYALSLWAKLTTPLVLLAALLFARFFQGRGLAGLGEAALVGMLGWGLFGVTWGGISAMTGMPIGYTIEVVSREAIESSLSTRDRFTSPQAFFQGVAPSILWIGPIFTALFLWAGLGRLYVLATTWRLTPADLVVVLGAAAYLPYIMKLAGNFPKYHAPSMPFWAATVAAFVVCSLIRPSWLTIGVIGLAGLAGFTRLAPMIGEVWSIQWTSEVISEGILPLILLGLALGTLTRVAPTSPRQLSWVASMAAVALAWALALNVHQRGIDASTAYYYGRNGQLAAARSLATLVKPGELYVASKEVFWYSGRDHYVDQDSWHEAVWGHGGGVWDGTWFGTPIRVLALEIGEESHHRAYEGALVRDFEAVEDHGNFRIYLRRG
jgi:hypothetical protein